MRPIRQLSPPTAAWTIGELAEHLGASETWVRDQVKAGRFPHFRVGRGVIRFLPEHVEAIGELITVPATTTSAPTVRRRRRRAA